MPYVHQRTWVQLAPKIRNLSLKESPYGFGKRKGMGLAPCPSDQQLMGITDPNDPCQNPVAALPVGGMSPTDLSILSSGLSTPPASTNSLTAWLQANQSTVLLVGAGLFGLALLSGVMGKR